MHTQFHRCTLRLPLPIVHANDLEKYERDSHIAIDYHERLIPSLVSSTRKIDCFTYCARDCAGGTFFDLFRAQADELDVVIGAINIEGIAESILVTGVQASLRCLIRQKVAMPDAVTEINRILWELAPDSVQGALLSVRVDPKSRSLRFINAGYHTAIVLRRGNGVEYMEPTAPPLALSRKSSYREHRTSFCPGDVLIIANGDIPEEQLGAMASRAKSSARLRDWAAEIGEGIGNSGVVMVISYREDEDGTGTYATPVAPPKLKAAA